MSDPRKDGQREGERRRDKAHDLLRSHRSAIIHQLKRAMVEAALRTGTATADDARDAVEIPAGINPKLAGLVGRDLATAGVFKAVGFVKSRRPKAHARPITVWELTRPEHGERWLIDNPNVERLTYEGGDSNGGI